MDIQVNKDQLERVVIKWLNKHFGNLIPKKHKNYPNSIFYVNLDNIVLMEYHEKNKNVYIHYDQIWSKTKSIFPLNHNYTQSIIKHWFEKTYDLNGVKPRVIHNFNIRSFKDI